MVVTDSRGSVGTVTVTSAIGTGTPPTLTAAPTTIASLTCGSAIPVTVIGGAGSLSATSQHPRITATVSGSTVTIRRLDPDPLPGPYPATGTVTITDGSSIVTITITATDPFC